MGFEPPPTGRYDGAMATEVRRKTYTYADLASTPPDSNRYEILSGELVVTPSPVTAHQLVSNEIFALLHAYARLSGGRALHAPMDVYFTETRVTEPDVLYLEKDRLHLIGRTCIEGAPDMVVEVLSPGTEHLDRGPKLEIYREGGVREYWIVDPDQRIVEVHDFPANVRTLLRPGLRLVSKAAPGFTADVADFFATLK